jgi:hypothetical protein
MLWTLFKWLMLVGLIAAAAGYAWVTASRVAGQEAVALKVENKQLTTQVATLETALRESKAQEAVLQDRLPSPDEMARRRGAAAADGNHLLCHPGTAV